MKVAILTITDGANYGNRLQNYALQRSLEKLDIEAETIQRKTSRDTKKWKKKLSNMKRIMKIILNKPVDRYRHNMDLRRKRFNNFNKKFVKFSKYSIGFNQAPDELNDKYDFFVCGSDQIWNARFDIISEDIKNHLAFFAKPEKKIAYAASFGTDNIVEEFLTEYKTGLSQFKKIMVREESGVGLVEKICGKEAEVVLDPTMLLSRDEWKQIEKKPTYFQDKKYIVTYFMSGRSKEIKNYIEKVKQKFNVDYVINLDIEFLDDGLIEDREVFMSDPSEFVWLIDHAECVLTDSFHATVFSILFHKPFCVFERQAKEAGNNMGSRIDTLLKKFGLKKYRNNILEPNVMPEVYDNDIEKILSEEREKSLSLLRQSLSIE